MTPPADLQGPARQSSEPAQADFARAAAAHRQGRLDEAIGHYERVIAAAPDHAGAWANIGAAHRRLGALSAAIACYRRALELLPGDPMVLGNLGNALKDAGRSHESIAIHRAAIAAAPADPRLTYNLAIALMQAGAVAQAQEVFERCCAMAPDDAAIEFDHALALLHLRQFKAGWRAYEARWRLDDLPPPPLRVPRWQGEAFPGKTLLVYPEQGFGDTILASRFLPQVKALGGTVILQSKRETRRLFDALAGVDRLCEGQEDALSADLQCPIMSLPGLLGATQDNIPPPARLTVPKSAGAKIAPIISGASGRFKIGIVWSGSLTFKGNAQRRAPLEPFIGLAEIPGIQLFSLQKGPTAAELANSGATALVIDLAPYLDDFADTAAAIAQLDLIVMTDSAVAHLGASLGRPVWNLLNAMPYWLYGTEGVQNAWYPSMRLFRQAEAGDWDSVFTQVSDALAPLISNLGKT
ncbi:MAG: tetratricopeptide repeat protein [Alphaproteobacteria bacterium]